MKTAVIMPTVRVPLNLQRWAPMLNPDTDRIIIAGNGISPHAEIIDFLTQLEGTSGVDCVYLHPQDDAVTRYQIANFLPPNHHNRRNLALLHALNVPVKQRPDVIVTIDDDNYPWKTTWLQGVHSLLRRGTGHPTDARPVLSAPSGWWNAGNLCVPPVVHRGFPITRWSDDAKTVINSEAGVRARIGVVASLWYGDPDINAVERALHDPRIADITGSVILDIGTWCPFDSQSTAVVGELAEMLFMWPGIGRYDDIWSSYVMRAVMDLTDWFVRYGHPAVYQERNEHNTVKDIREELHGYEHTEKFTTRLRRLVEEFATTVNIRRDPFTVFRWIMTDLATDQNTRSYLPDDTRDSLLAWLTDVESLRTGVSVL